MIAYGPRVQTKSIVLLLPFLSIACASRPIDQTQPDDWKSGTRLQAQVYRAGSAKLFKTWHDTQLDMDCAFSRASDGQLRCQAVDSEQTDMYSDSNCTQPVWLPSGDMQCNGDSSFYFRVFVPPTSICPSGVPPQYKAGPQVTLPIVYAHDLTSGACGQALGPTTVYTGTLVDPATLVAAQSSVLPVGDRLGVEQLTADDGATQLRAISDRQRNFECMVASGNEVDRCVPTTFATQNGQYTDANCMTAIASYSTCGSPPSAVLVSPWVGSSCSSPKDLENDFAEVGPSVATFAYDDTSGQCVAEALNDPTIAGYSTGAAIPATALAAITYKYEGGSGQVVAQTMVAPTGERLRALSLYDTKAQTYCYPGNAADGQLRCIPSTPAFATFFYADANCTRPLVDLSKGCTPPAFAAVVGPSACGATPYHIFQLGAAHPSTTLFESDNGNCEPSTGFGDSNYYELGEEVDPTSFEAVTVSAE